MKKIYIIVFCLVAIIGFKILINKGYFIDVSSRTDAVKDSLCSFKDLLEVMPSKQEKIKNLKLGKTYLSSDLALLDGFSPAMTPLDIYANRKYVDQYKQQWRFVLINGKLKVWSVGVNEIDEDGKGDDQFILIDIDS